MPDPIAQLLAWRAARAKRDVILASEGPDMWTCHLYDAHRLAVRGANRRGTE